MPELPEVETICSGIQPLVQQKINQVIIRQYQLRFKVPSTLTTKLKNTEIKRINRRGKYLLFTTSKGTLIVHLGMSGRLRLHKKLQLPTAEKHDHMDIITDQLALRFTDPRRFGLVLWTSQDPLTHRLIESLGVEPLDQEFDTEYLWQKSRHKKIMIKPFIMNSKIVVGVGNIYAAEALFTAKIHPQTITGNISRQQCQNLVTAIQQVLEKAIACGGTTLNDFCDSQGTPGYFKQELQVYGRDKEPCLSCKRSLKKIILAQRSTVFCSHCQLME